MFAAFSVRIHAIIPPRATELRLLSSTEPTVVQVVVSGAVEESRAGDEESDTPRRRHGARSDDYIEEIGKHPRKAAPQPPLLAPDKGSPVIIEDDDAKGYTDDQYIDQDQLPGPQTAGRTILPGNHRRQLDFEEPVAIIGKADRADLPKVDIAEVVDYYQDLMSCMQEFQLTDFTNALKSCISSSRKTYIHIAADKYFTFQPRYPFVFINEYLQEIPDPVFNVPTRITALDSSILMCILFVVLLGAAMAMYRMNALACHSSAPCCAARSKMAYLDSSGHHRRRLYDEDRGQLDDDASAEEPKGARGSTISHLWGTVGWYPQNQTRYQRIAVTDMRDGTDEDESLELLCIDKA
jgi:hypothetical protein